MTEQRRLAAILVADVAGYSKLMGSDEAGTLAQLEVLRTNIIEPQIAKHAGRLFKSNGKAACQPGGVSVLRRAARPWPGRFSHGD
jgi:class 3 adenylate cyclase